MPYHLSGSFDGACRLNGTPQAFGGAGIHFPFCPQLSGYRSLRSHPYFRVTNQVAELTGLVMILETALDKKSELKEDPFFVLHVKSDSVYAIGCVTRWHQKWKRNGWRNARGVPVANRDLIKQALDLIQQLEVNGEVKFEKVGRDQNQEADKLANEGCNEA
jgi:ribonuclease HI